VCSPVFYLYYVLARIGSDRRLYFRAVLLIIVNKQLAALSYSLWQTLSERIQVP
jgi:hypothetical protein